MNNALLKPLLDSAILNLTHPTLWYNGAIGAQKWYKTAAILHKRKQPALIIAPNELKAKEIFDNMHYFFRDNCYIYPSRDFLFYAADVKSVDITRQRLKILDRLKDATAPPPIVILSAEALLDRMTPPDKFYSFTLSLSVGDICEPETLIRKLSQMGYERAGLIEGPGQFALRGGILDIYPAVGHYTIPKDTEPHLLQDGQALRIEFFGDDIDSVRVVDALSQRSVENGDSFTIYPVRELVFGKSALNNAIAAIKTATEKQVKHLRPEQAKTLADSIKYTLDNWDLGSTSQVEAFLPFFYQEETCLLDYLPQNTTIFFDEPGAIKSHIDVVIEEYGESVKHRLESGRLLPAQAHVLMQWGSVLQKSEKFYRVLYSSIVGKLEDFPTALEIPITVRACAPLSHNFAELKKEISRFLKADYILVILAGSRRQAEQLTSTLNDLEIPAIFKETLTDTALTPGITTITRGILTSGFDYPEIKLAVITGESLFATERSKKRKRKRHKNAEKINHFTDLKIGDYIVHDNHGIGIFRGIEKVTTEDITRDYIKLEYNDGGFIYVQTNHMDFIHKYIGGKAEAKLSKLGGADWAKAKAKARATVKILAEDLISLYAKREAAVAHKYGSDTVWQQEFEQNFPYQETDDQLTAIEDVKRDMESTKVMDRLICGDVGYGKTEIAIRAAFKAVQDGKQVAYLVPTTILTQQHYQTFTQRMKEYPITIGRLSRFQSKKEQTQTLKDLALGKVDIVIGTHRLLSKDVSFKDLGLVIVDEEQRFGVGHKEKLKALRANVDVLTLTATPIPRTLHFSLTGIRDMSILDEPPEERIPIQTYVMEHNPEFVRDAINRELARGGQVFYLHNRVRNIAEEAMRVAQLVPHARVSFAHGQMSETELENIMHDFVEDEIDVLVCTTIIETGLDISNANTMIIQNADQMGLSQLYQLRGRVGRSSRLAYAYLMYRRDKVLKEEAEKRLQTIREFTEFGAGFKIAMRDLEIRGAGNLLGAEQHGQMDLVGYDMYCKLLADAVAELKGEPAQPSRDITIDLEVDAYIPSYLIHDEETKLEMYKKIALVNNPQDYMDVQDEIEDRFGTIPAPVTNLLDVALLKSDAVRLGVTQIKQKGLNTLIMLRPDANVDLDKLTTVVMQNSTRLLFTMADAPYITMRGFKDDAKPDDGGAWRVKEVHGLLQSITE